MFCPQCGHEQIAAEVRYCSRCGFELSVVRACLAGVSAPDGAQPAVSLAPRQRNINLGVVLMFLGTLLTSLVVASSNTKIEGAFFMLLTCFLSLLLFSRPIVEAFARLTPAAEPHAGALPARRKELSYGATFMFIAALLSGCAAAAAPGGTETPMFFSLLLSLCGLLLLTSHRIMRAAQVLMSDGKEQQQGAAATMPLPQAGGNSVGRALPPARSVPVSVFTAQPATTAEMVAPPSVTERTTSLLQD